MVAWSKGKKTNVYLCGPLPEDRYDKVGLEVPQKAAQMFNLGIVYFGDKRTVVNIQDQHDAPFLISESGAIVSEFLGSVSGLDKLFAVVDSVAVDIRRSKTVISDREEQLKNVEVQIERLVPVVAYKDEVDRIVDRLKAIEVAKQDIVLKQSKFAQLFELNNFLAEVDVGVSTYEPQVKSLELELVAFKEKEVRNAVILQNLTKIEAYFAELKALDGLEVREKAMMQNLLAEAEKVLPTSGICPLCGQPVTAECAKQVLNNLRTKYANS